MTLLDFQLVLRPNLRPPHFASKVSYSAIATTFAASALKGQQVPSPGQRPGYHVPIPYAL